MSRILVVDDEPGLRKVVRDGLERAGHEVETAVDGDEAMGFLEEKEFDLVVTDLTMPKKGGSTSCTRSGGPRPYPSWS